jgi:serine/threonine-protein kinase
MESLAERILFSAGGSFLVTGYRGVGKTSYINQVIRKLEDALPWAEQFLGKTQLVDIYLNLARPAQPSEIMHHIIRQLHDRLVEKNIYQLLDPDLQESLTLAYYRTSVNMARKLAETSERSFGFNEASIGSDWMKAAVKLSLNSKRSRSQNYEISYLGYDDKAAEHDLINISRRLMSGYSMPVTTWQRLKRGMRGTKRESIRLKIVFVFDELDKLEEFTQTSAGDQRPVIDQILGALKNLFTTSGVTFVFVAGKDLQERWLEDVGKGDSIYESVFSYDRYLPCLWADVDLICDMLVDKSLPHGRQVYREFKQFLAYKGRGIPRRIIRTFNEYVEWRDGQPVLAFTPQSLRRIRFFAGLQGVLRAHEKSLFGESHEEILGTQSDKRRLGVYYLIDWILRQGSSSFTRNDVLTASKHLSAKIALAEEIAPGIAEQILQILIGGDYIQEIRNTLNEVMVADAKGSPVATEKRYKLTPRRLVEFGGLGAESDVDPGFPLSVEVPRYDKFDEISRVGKYKIVKGVGSGGMGMVFEAIDHSGRRVAIKMIARELMDQKEVILRFEREAMIMSELDHPNIVRLYDWDRDHNQIYIVMEFVEGPTLDVVINRSGLPLELAIAVIEPLIEAVDYLHRKGFVRHDIKPQNIKLTPSGRVCLLDFGITRPTSEHPKMLEKFQTITGGIVGTPMYMAPEQLKEPAANEGADIYALGVVLYNMLTGRLPFEYKASIHELFTDKLESAPIPPSQFVILPLPVEQLVLKCLEKDQSSRYQSAGELLDALHRATQNIAKVDLKSALKKVEEKVKEVEAMDHMVTAIPESAMSLPASMEVSISRRVRPVSSSTLASLDPATPQPKFEETVAMSDSTALIILLEGPLENIDISLDRAGDGYLLDKTTTFGRSSDNHIVLRDRNVSRYQGKFALDEEGWYVEDFNSNQGVHVNGKRINIRQSLFGGEKIAVGDFVFVFEPH